jgi:tetratricopeptide (TPR) repeat protein
MTLKKYTLLIAVFLALTTLAQAELPKEQVYSLFNQANQYFRQGNTAGNTEQAAKFYEQAILSYEKIIDQGGIRNAKLYYNLANTYFLMGKTGKAILNYHRAANLENDNDIEKNLNFACSQRKDQVAIKTQKRILQTLFFWHYDFNLKIKFLMACIFWGIACICVTIMIWRGRKITPCMVTAVIFGIAAVCLISSIVIENRTQAQNIGGVITTAQVIAYQGDSKNYPASFKEPLHDGTEFTLLEKRAGWLHIKLFDESDGWIPDQSAELI